MDRPDQRKYQRFLKKAVIKINAAEEESLLSFYTQDISEGGAQIITDRDYLTVGQYAELVLDFFHDPLPLNIKCIVVYAHQLRQGYRVGLKFVDMDEFERVRLKKFLEKKESGLGEEI